MPGANHHIYFASDFHLGVPDHESSLIREKRIVKWLNKISLNATEIYLMGDLFDFWFEHKYTAPKGYVRLLGKLAELSDSGVKIHLFTGNHDMWMFGYLQKELNAEIYHGPIIKEYNGKKFYLAHGDGLGPGEYNYKFIKKIFANRFFQWCYARIHPNLAFGIANYLSARSRKKNHDLDSKYLGDEKEWLFQYCHELLKKEHYDFMVFGHRHLVLDKSIGASRYINLGDWIKYNTYGYFDGENFTLTEFKE
jgi:UDP-2,3-diacylglucosamine hydrolase